MIDTKPQIAELSYATYVNRQQEKVAPVAVKADLEKLKRGNKFNCDQGTWKGNDYEGYAVVSMLSENPGNEELSTELNSIVSKLKEVMNAENDFYFLPKESYHQTVANTLSAGRFYEFVKDKGLEGEYPKIIENAFDRIEGNKASKPIEMKITGLSVFGSSFGVLGSFENETDFNAIINFRDDFYTQPSLKEIDIRRTRPFIGHITLGYFENDQMISEDSKSAIAEMIHKINTEISEKELVFKISNSELRKYYDLSEFTTQASYPKFQF